MDAGLGKFLSYTEAYNLQGDTLGPEDEPKEPCTSATQTTTTWPRGRAEGTLYGRDTIHDLRSTQACMQVRHVMPFLAIYFFISLCFTAPCVTLYFISLRTRSVGGGGCCCQTLSLFVLFSLFSIPRAGLTIMVSEFLGCVMMSTSRHPITDCCINSWI